jgi:hypothetical protein
VINQRIPFNIYVFPRTHIKTQHQHWSETTWIDTQPTNSQGAHIYAKHDMIYEFDKKRCCPSIAHCNEIMNLQNNTPFGVPNHGFLFTRP